MEDMEFTNYDLVFGYTFAVLGKASDNFMLSVGSSC